LTEKKPEPILTGLKEIVNKDKRSGKKWKLWIKD
jgi:hypothetical protein